MGTCVPEKEVDQLLKDLQNHGSDRFPTTEFEEGTLVLEQMDPWPTFFVYMDML